MFFLRSSQRFPGAAHSQTDDLNRRGLVPSRGVARLTLIIQPPALHRIVHDCAHVIKQPTRHVAAWETPTSAHWNAAVANSRTIRLSCISAVPACVSRGIRPRRSTALQSGSQASSECATVNLVEGYGVIWQDEGLCST